MTMDELYDNQDKPKKNFDKLLQVGIDKANPQRRKRTKEERLKQGKLNGIFDTLSCEKTDALKEVKRLCSQVGFMPCTLKDSFAQVRNDYELKNFK